MHIPDVTKEFLMSNKEQLIQDLTQEQVDAVAGGNGELLPRYLRTDPEDTKGGGDPRQILR